MKSKKEKEALDWQGARKRLARALAGTEESWRLTPERQRAILEERARALARAPAAPAPREPSSRSSSSTWAPSSTPSRRATSARSCGWANTPPLPGAPAFLLGVLNLRGEILAVLDLRSFFGLAAQGAADLSWTLVLGGDSPRVRSGGGRRPGSADPPGRRGPRTAGGRPGRRPGIRAGGDERSAGRSRRRRAAAGPPAVHRPGGLPEPLRHPQAEQAGQNVNTLGN